MNDIYKGASNLRINFSTGADLTGYTTVQFLVNYPNGDITTLTGVMDDASTGAIYYTTASGTILSTSGAYQWQPWIVFSDSTAAYGDPVKILVKPVLT